MRNWMIGWKKSLAKTEKEAVTGADQVSLIPTSRLRLHQTAKLPQVKKLMNSPLPLPPLPARVPLPEPLGARFNLQSRQGPTQAMIRDLSLVPAWTLLMKFVIKKRMVAASALDQRVESEQKRPSALAEAGGPATPPASSPSARCGGAVVPISAPGGARQPSYAVRKNCL